MLILGVDPGLVNTGYAIINFTNQKKIELIKTSNIKTKASCDIASRLSYIYENIKDQTKDFDIKNASIEQSLVNVNASSSMVLAMSRAIILLYFSQSGMSYKEYLPTHIKKSISGNGNANKDQIGNALKYYIKLEDKKISHHEQDAIAIAICYALNYNSRL